MFSNSSFNALLKTLEEPPPHVKFLLATTEPKKLPITVLSRCLQFNLKRLTLPQISNHLVKLLDLQKVEHDKSAIELIARAADGSMRDGLSLLDQSLAFGAGKVTDSDVKLMLGTMDQDSVIGLLDAIIDKNAEELSAKLKQIFTMSPDYSLFLNDMALLLHEISLLQILNNYVDNSAFDRRTIKTLAEKTSAEQVQLFYQIVLKGQNEINLAPDSKTGFEMTIIRMFAFKFGNLPTSDKTTSATQPQHVGQQQTTPQQMQPKPSISERMNAGIPENGSNAPHVKQTATEPVTEPVTQSVVSEPVTPVQKYNLTDFTDSNWHNLFNELTLKGTARELARNGHIISNVDGELVLAIDKQAHAFMTEGAQNKLINAIKMICNDSINITLTQDVDAKKTIAKSEQIKRDTHVQETKQKVNENQFVQHMQDNFDAQVIQIKQGQNFLEV